jgi:hypothetical protein
MPVTYWISYLPWIQANAAIQILPWIMTFSGLTQMPCDLSKMLAQHTQSMFQHNAPPLRPGHMEPHHHHQGCPSACGKLVAPTYEGYQEKIY